MKEKIAIGMVAVFTAGAAIITSIPSELSALALNTHQAAPTELTEGTYGPRISGKKKSTSIYWSGYAVQTDMADPAMYSVTEVRGSWIVPTISCNGNQTTYSVAWVGIDGNQSKTVEQIGTQHDCVKGVPVYFAWYEMYPKSQVNLEMAIHPGDHISASVTYEEANTYVFNITNNTTGETYVTSVVSRKPVRNSAEWIVEGTGPLADFDTVTFTDASATVLGHTGSISDPAWQYEPITMVQSKNGYVKAVPGALSPDGSSFTVHWMQQ